MIVQVEQILDKLMGNSIAWVVLALATIISLVIGVLGFMKGYKKKEISYYCKTNRIIKAGKTLIPKLDLKYADQDIDDLSITRIVIWNSGREVINKNDMVEKKPLAIVSSKEEAIILECNSIKENEPANEFEIINECESNVIIKFEYLEKSDGLVVQIMHSGTIDDLEVVGKLKGGKIRSLWKNKKKKNVRTIRRMTVFMCILLILLLWEMFWDLITRAQSNGWNSFYKVMVVFLPLYNVVMMDVIIKIIKRELYMYVPSAFRSEFMEDEVENW